MWLMTLEKKAISFASTMAAILAISKLTIGLISGSMALISSAVDSLLDLIVSFVNLFAIKTSEEWPDSEHNYGHGKIEGIAALFEGLIILTSGWWIVYSAIEKMINKTSIDNLDWSIWVMVWAMVLTGAVVYILARTAKKTNSLIVKADLMHYKTDLLTNLGIIISLVIVKFTGIDLIDQIVAIAIAIYIIICCVPIMKEGFDLIMDKSLWKDKEIIAIIMRHPEITTYRTLQTRKSGKRYFVNVDIVFANKNISLYEAHQISDEIEWEIQKVFNHKTQVIIHLDLEDDNRK